MAELSVDEFGYAGSVCEGSWIGLVSWFGGVESEVELNFGDRLFYSYRKHKALEAKPNLGHYALTELAKKMPDFITLTQNVDGK